MRPVSIALTLFLTLVTAAVGRADRIAVPSQAGWDAARKTVALPGGPALAYVEMGDPAGPPTLLLHGYTDSSRGWSPIAPWLADRHLYALDLRGHGRSDAPACCYAYADFADDAARFLDAVGVARADVIGHSLGSMVAQSLAARHPAKVGGLVLVSSTTAMEVGPGTALWEDVMALREPIDPDGAFLRRWIPDSAALGREFVARERAEAAAMPIHVWRGVLRAMATEDLAPVASEVKAPVLVLWGERDRLFDLDHQQKLEKVYPDAEFRVLANGGHTMFRDMPQSAARVIEDFLDDR